MTPADQEFIHAPEQGLIGDCQRAVIASLLDLPIAEVPHFMKEANGDTTKYWELLQSFVRSHGFAWLVVPARSGGGFFGDDGDVYHEISGPSPRGNGITHAVVGCNGEIVFDPHPSRAGLAGDSSEWEYAYLVRVSAAPRPGDKPLEEPAKVAPEHQAQVDQMAADAEARREKERGILLEAANHLEGDGHFMPAEDADWAAGWIRRQIGAGATP